MTKLDINTSQNLADVYQDVKTTLLQFYPEHSYTLLSTAMAETPEEVSQKNGVIPRFEISGHGRTISVAHSNSSEDGTVSIFVRVSDFTEENTLASFSFMSHKRS